MFRLSMLTPDSEIETTICEVTAKIVLFSV
jgi:hypothetical protein